ncbi:cytoplasmic protein [Bacillus sp. ISL-40]|uniref:cytoplasmic protein n=1 Tax=unclassified Bacillus (in: firmicutes) TaxID=185979 RepID=UPI001BE7AF88|nr:MULTISPECIES: cytoplasmic protein [unclassified Bacillus (in: firmicutes)]MBT2701370.1 cytoplasmic protein [Bacillus sp. ISL-40]MBT2719687.1 cytoplasmic protein [Bacillus sp. ISL-46]MBT2744483.1 cytoplasmic protein [Bacillus sp. ISL-77]
MDTKSRGDLVINGFGASNGGQFRVVTLNGRGTVNDDLECVELDCNGSGILNGNVISEKAKVNGHARFRGSIDSKILTIDGSARIDKNLSAEKLKVSGKATVGGRVKCEEIKIQGTFTVSEDCEAEIFKAESQFTIGGLLNADQVDIKMFGECKAKEIGGQTITVKAKGSLVGNLLKAFFKPQLETELIEGDKIELENTIAKVVRGNQVWIGPNCQIGLVEYTEEFSMDKKAIVTENRKV